MLRTKKKRTRTMMRSVRCFGGASAAVSVYGFRASTSASVVTVESRKIPENVSNGKAPSIYCWTERFYIRRMCLCVSEWVSVYLILFAEWIDDEMKMVWNVCFFFFLRFPFSWEHMCILAQFSCLRLACRVWYSDSNRRKNHTELIFQREKKK